MSLSSKAAIKACSKSPYKSSEGSHARSLPLGWDLPTGGAQEAPQLQHRTTSLRHHQECREDSPAIPARLPHTRIPIRCFLRDKSLSLPAPPEHEDISSPAPLVAKEASSRSKQPPAAHLPTSRGPAELIHGVYLQLNQALARP